MPVEIKGKHLRIKVVPTTRKYKTYRTHDIGRAGHTKRLAGQLRTGRWETVSYLIPKKDIRKMDAKTYSTLWSIAQKVPKKDRPALSRALKRII